MPLFASINLEETQEERPHWNNAWRGGGRGSGFALRNNYFNLTSTVMSHRLWIMSSKGLIADSIPLFTLSLSLLQLRRRVQPLPASSLRKDTVINHLSTSLYRREVVVVSRRGVGVVLCPRVAQTRKRWVLIPALCPWPPVLALIPHLSLSWRGQPSAVPLSLHL